jgi:RNA polymerase sigma-70 factor (ECF subfamily)
MTPSDSDLLRGLQARDEEAFILLYRRWQGPLYRYALRVSGSPALAEDVTQEVFMALLHGSDGYDPERGAVSSYLHGMARNMVNRRLKRDPAARPVPEVAAPDDPLADVARREVGDLVWSALLALSLPFREAVILCDLQGFTYDQAAAILGCALGTVRSRLHRGRAQLAERLRSVRPLARPAAAGRAAR